MRGQVKWGLLRVGLGGNLWGDAGKVQNCGMRGTSFLPEFRDGGEVTAS
jgi:hypothetical protein